MIIKNLAPDKNDFQVIGMMSGTSLDGMDLCYAHFKLNNNLWSFEIKHSTTIHYASDWEEKLKNCRFLSGEELTKLDIEFGDLTGKFILEFIKENQVAFESDMPLNMGQILSIPMVLMGLFFLLKSFQKVNEEGN